jgi:small ligand-binding sensory domain FIST
MPVADSHSTLPDLDDAVSHVCGEVRASLQGVVPDLLFVFVSHDHADHFDALPRMLQRQLGPKVLLGCAAETVIGGMHEIEEGPALCIWAGVFPEIGLPHEWWALREERKLLVRRMEDGEASTSEAQRGVQV